MFATTAASSPDKRARILFYFALILTYTESACRIGTQGYFGTGAELVASHAQSLILQIASVFACVFASASHAVNLNNDGTGQVLIFPYYTVQSGNQTLISVHNTSQFGKAVKLRIFEARNSREVLSLNLYLSPEDIWTAAIFAPTDSGPGALVSIDRSCIVPQISESGEQINGITYRSFTNFNYVSANADGGPSSLDRTREGHIEVIEMASILSDSELHALICHENGVAAECEQLAREWITNPGGSGPYFSSLAAAAGGLSGSAAIVNSSQGTFINYSPEVLDGFYQITEHTRPDSPLPSLRSARPESIVLVDGEAIRSTWAKPEDAVSALFMAERVRNEFTSELALNAASEWVLSFPTKRFYTDSTLSALTPIPAPPFTQAFVNGNACETGVHHLYDRHSSRFTASMTGTSAPLQPLLPIRYCSSVNTLTIQQALNQTTGVLSAGNATNAAVPIRFPSGWLDLDFSAVVTGGASLTRTLRASLEGHIFVGLPVIGFSAIRLENHSAAPGIRAFYGGAINHKRKIRCLRTNSDGQNTSC